MAVFKHAYKGYDGPLTPAWSRFLILPRYAFEEMRRKRFYSMFFLVSMLGPSAATGGAGPSRRPRRCRTGRRVRPATASSKTRE